MAEVLYPGCPLCGGPPRFTVGDSQAFCGNDDCNLIMWNPAVSAEGNLTDAGVVRFPGEGDGDGGR